MTLIKLTRVRVLAMAVCGGFAVPALADCPELEQLQRAYYEASERVSQQIAKAPPWAQASPLERKVIISPSRELCGSYRRLAEATKAWVDYARQHDELCRFSGLLPMMEYEYLRAVEARDNICAGRPAHL